MAQLKEDILVEQRLAAEAAGYHHHYEIIMQPHASQQEIVDTGDALDAILADPYGIICRG